MKYIGNEEEIYHSILLREQYRAMAEQYEKELDMEEQTVNYHRIHVEQRDAYRKALEDILKATTVTDMIRIANSVLKENKRC